MSSTNFESGPDDIAVFEAARKRVSQRPRSFLSLPKLRYSHSASSFTSSVSTKARKHHRSRASQSLDDVESAEELPELGAESSEAAVIERLPSINIDDSLLNRELSNEYRPHAEFKWAIIYENQRGITVFSIPHYSRLALLPTDPYPFTAPSSIPITRKNANSNLSPDTYPLPSGEWRWVSKAWMIDMRSADDGEVAHDGFEYNLLGFKQHGWRAHTNTFAWVRRRRWVRLMYRPAKHAHHGAGLASALGSVTSMPGTPISASSLFPPPVVGGQLENDLPDPFTIPPDEIFLGEDTESDYIRCSALLKHAGRDGKRIELWETWLGLRSSKPVDPTLRDSSGEANPGINNTPPISMTLEAGLKRKDTQRINTPLEAMAMVISAHGSDILRSFTYPASRERMLAILAQADLKLLSDTNTSSSTRPTVSSRDFWSYTEEQASTRDPGAN